MSPQQEIDLVRAIRGDSTLKDIVLGGLTWAGASIIMFLASVRYLHLAIVDTRWSWGAGIVSVIFGFLVMHAAMKRTRARLEILEGKSPDLDTVPWGKIILAVHLAFIVIGWLIWVWR